jgi:hypothetical protein
LNKKYYTYSSHGTEFGIFLRFYDCITGSIFLRIFKSISFWLTPPSIFHRKQNKKKVK